MNRLVVDAWQRANGRFAGQLFGSDPERPLLVFYFDAAGTGMLDRLDRGESLPSELLRSELTSGDVDRELDALLALDQLGEPRPDLAVELLDLLPGGAHASTEVAFHAASQLSKLLIEDTYVGLRRPMPVYWVVEADQPLHVAQVSRNWESLLAVATEGVVGRDLTDDESLIAGTYETFGFSDCGSGWTWNESCGLALTLLCNGYAFWNDGVAIKTARWALREGVLTFDADQPDLAGLVDPERSVGDWIASEREGYSDWRRCG